jgi:hypothetical protein
MQGMPDLVDRFLFALSELTVGQKRIFLEKESDPVT